MTEPKPTIEEQIAVMVERRDNALIIAENKTGTDRDEWLQDAAEYDAILASLRELAAIRSQPVPVEPKEFPHVPAAYINAIAEGGDKREAIEFLQKTWNELCAIRQYTNDLQSALQVAQQEIHVVFDGPPSNESGRFVEVENAEGKSVEVGRWEQRGNYWHLILGGEK